MRDIIARLKDELDLIERYSDEEQGPELAEAIRKFEWEYGLMREHMPLVLQDGFTGSIIDVSVKEPEMRVLLQQTESGVSLLTEKTLSLVLGPPKSRKTMFLTAMCASLLGCKDLGMTALDPEGKFSAVYIDTEQSRGRAILTCRRIHRLAGWDEHEANPRLTYLSLRSNSQEECLAGVAWACRSFNPTVIFLDGLVDTCKDFNDIRESSNLVRHLMALGELYNTHICAALHVNKDKVTERGHLGAIYKQKADTTFFLKPSETMVEVSPDLQGCRDLPFLPMRFTFDEENLPHCVSGAPAKVASKDDTLLDLALNILKNEPKRTMRMKELVKQVQLATKSRLKPEGMAETSVRDSVQNLVRAGKLVKTNNTTVGLPNEAAQTQQAVFAETNSSDDKPPF